MSSAVVHLQQLAALDASNARIVLAAFKRVDG
jgi:hypothetical protein